jgi:hypothetical protein
LDEFTGGVLREVQRNMEKFCEAYIVEGRE